MPSRIVSSTELEDRLSLGHGVIERLTGIRNRRYFTNEESLQSMSVEACQEALVRSGLDASDIDSLIFYSDSPPVLPEKEGPRRNYYDISAHIQHLLKERGITLACECLAIAGSCVSFLISLQIAVGMIRSGMKRNIILIGAAWNSLFLDDSDKNTAMTFGDGAAACILGASPDKGFLGIFAQTDGQGYRAGCYPDYQSLFIDRKRISEFAPKALHAGVKGLLDKTGLRIEDVDVFIPHQAGIKIIERGMALSGIPAEKVYLCLQEVGNTGAPAVQLALAKAVEDGKVRDGNLVVLAAFGTGWNYGAAAFRYNRSSHAIDTAEG
ncbi:MAG: ketoacyl-ACP synthase III [Candidatus Aminicenantes bacterium]|nr:ketoacyl-ACP synthase III [Candidatus Aminicenantes bacterium]